MPRDSQKRKKLREKDQFADTEIFDNWKLVSQYADEGKSGIEIKKIDRALAIPPQYLSKDGLRHAVYKHLKLNIKRFVPEYEGIYSKGWL